MGLIRMLLMCGGIYICFIVAFPDWTASPYHFISIAVMVGGATALHVAMKMMKVVSIVSLLFFEVAFAGLAMFYLAYTMPTKSGKAPVQQWAEGYKPTRDTAREGFERLGFDPKKGLAKAVVSLFPK